MLAWRLGKYTTNHVRDRTSVCYAANIPQPPTLCSFFLLPTAHSCSAYTTPVSRLVTGNPSQPQAAERTPQCTHALARSINQQPTAAFTPSTINLTLHSLHALALHTPDSKDELSCMLPLHICSAHAALVAANDARTRALDHQEP
jgi:hypothetical protein